MTDPASCLQDFIKHKPVVSGITSYRELTIHLSVQRAIFFSLPLKDAQLLTPKAKLDSAFSMSAVSPIGLRKLPDRASSTPWKSPPAKSGYNSVSV
jgi:hypothetical protein